MVEIDDVGANKAATHITACVTCTSVTVPDAVPGRTYQARVWPVARDGSAGVAATSGAIALTDPLCASAQPCFSIDTRQQLGPMTHTAGGFNGGWDVLTTELNMVSALAPTWARVDVHADPATWAEMRLRNISTTFMADSWWRTQRQARNESIVPWDNWALYASETSRMVRDMAALGEVPTYWEIQNEPDMPGAYGASIAPTRTQILQQFKVAYQAIKAVNPDAKIIGPSLTGFYWNEPSRPIDLQSFLDFADANQLQFAGLAWHEDGAEGDVDMWSVWGRTIASHVARAKVGVVASTAMKAAVPVVSEVVPGWMSGLPGGMIGWLSHIENTGATQVSLSCWPTPNDPMPGDMNVRTACGSGTFDGLRHSNHQPTDTFVPHLHYTWTLTGTKVTTVANRPGWAGMATVAPDGSVAALVARNDTCRSDVNPLCPKATDDALHKWPGVAAGGANLDVRLSLGLARTAGASVRIQATPFHASNNTFSTPYVMPTPVVDQTAKVASNGLVSITLPGVADGDTWLVRVLPA